MSGRSDWERLAAWYRDSARDLPWRRRSGDPWAVLVSEVMLQQTRVETVLAYYEPFLDRFPSPAHLAGAGIEDVLAAWSGLGYYRRARSLHAAAVEIERRHRGLVPCDPEDLLALPGVGPYTAAAVLSIAFGERHPVLDGNAVRVLARYHALVGNPARATLRRRLRGEADRALEGQDPGSFNQALMELGATLCHPERPGCARCPIARGCRARAQGEIGRIPELPRPRATVNVQRAIAAIRRGERLLLERRSGRRLEGFLEFPGVDVLPEDHPPERLARHLSERLGLQFEIGERLGSVRHRITHNLIVCHVHRAVPRGRLRTAGDSLLWLAPGELANRPVPAQTRLVLGVLSRSG